MQVIKGGLLLRESKQPRLGEERRLSTHLVGLVVGHQLVDGRGLGDLQQDGLRLLPALRRPRAHVTQVTGARALALTGAVHAHAGRHAFGARVQQAGDVGRVGERPRLLVALL